MSKKIFISYRRSDSDAVVDRITEHLARVFDQENVTRDIDSFAIGDDFRAAISESVASCDVLLAVMGPRWLTAQDQDGRRRLDLDKDFVRIEIEAALRRKVPVIPVLLGDTPMAPPEQLPESLRDLSYRGAARVRPDPDFATDIARLIKAIRRDPSARRTGGDPGPLPRRRLAAWALAAGVIVVAFAAIIWGWPTILGLLPGEPPGKKVVVDPPVVRGWNVDKKNAEGLWVIAHDAGEELATLSLRDGYFRLKRGTTYGTTVVLPPTFWSGGVLTQGMPLDATHRVEGDLLIIDATGQKNGLKVNLKVALKLLETERIEAEVGATCKGTVTLDNRPGEAFQLVKLLSMRAGPGADGISREWDARAMIVEGSEDLEFDDRATNAPLVDPNKYKVRRFGFRGGKSDYQKKDPAPTVEIVLDKPFPIAGYRLPSKDHDANLALWAGSDAVLGDWHYIITAWRP